MVTDIRAVCHFTAIIGLIECGLMLIVAAAGAMLGWHSSDDFLTASALCGFGTLLVALATRTGIPRFSPRLGFLLVNSLWWVSGVICAIPFMFALPGTSFIDAVFESVSGITTTGSTVMTGLDNMDHGVLLWRSLLQWVGGVGILSLGLFLLPYLRVGGMQLFRMESSDRTDIPVPRFVALTKMIIAIYLVISLSCALAYHFSGMSIFDAINHAMTSVSTGGFSTHDASFGFFENSAALWIASIFMMLGALPFGLFIGWVFVRTRRETDPQVGAFLVLILLAVIILIFGRTGADAHTLRSLSEDVFNVISVMTTTGYAAGDYTKWAGPSVALFFFITFFGGCAGSTAGGIKTYRLVVMFALVNTAIREWAHPSGVFIIRYGRRPVPQGIFRASMVMISAFLAALALLTILLGALGLDFLTAISASATALANVGPGLGDTIGPAGTFATLPGSAKLVLCVAMMLGRLEILVVLVLFSPMIWRA